MATKVCPVCGEGYTRVQRERAEPAGVALWYVHNEGPGFRLACLRAGEFHQEQKRITQHLTVYRRVKGKPGQWEESNPGKQEGGPV